MMYVAGRHRSCVCRVCSVPSDPKPAPDFFGARIGRKSGVLGRPRAMVFGTHRRATMSLLISISVVAGVQAIPSSSSGSPTATYDCCCPGECQCTGDCCHHGPEKALSGQAPQLRAGADEPMWRVANQCGVWLVTLQRTPGYAKLMSSESRLRGFINPSHQPLRSPEPPAISSLAACLASSSPRAPPNA